MKQIKNIILLTALMFSFTISNSFAQIKNAKSETVKVYGNCNLCKNNIETAANKKYTSKAAWSIDNKTVVLIFDSVKTTADEILKNIAYAGYDNQNYMAPDEAYNRLEQCCQYERWLQKEKTKPREKTNTSLQMDTKKNTTKFVGNTNQLSSVYNTYFGLKDALTKDDGATAATKAKELCKAIDSVLMEKLTLEQHTIWMKYQKLLSYDAAHIKVITDTEKQRQYFVTLSKNMYQVMKAIKNDATVYYDFCPMANDGKGANWLSLQQAISNPYMGKLMPTCGKVEEKINNIK